MCLFMYPTAPCRLVATLRHLPTGQCTTILEHLTHQLMTVYLPLVTQHASVTHKRKKRRTSLLNSSCQSLPQPFLSALHKMVDVVSAVILSLPLELWKGRHKKKACLAVGTLWKECCLPLMETASTLVSVQSEKLHVQCWIKETFLSRNYASACADVNCTRSTGVLPLCFFS